MDTSQWAMSRRQLVGGLVGLAVGSSSLKAEPLFRPTELNHLTLNVSDLERSRAFYGKLFGGPQWAVSPASVDWPQGGYAFDLGASPLGIYLVPQQNSIGIDHFCVAIQGFNSDTVVSTLKQHSLDARPGVDGSGINFRDPDRIHIELAAPHYRNRSMQAEPQKEFRPSTQPLFRPVALNHVTLQVSDLERSTKFYESLFGPSLSQSGGGTIPNVRLGVGVLAWGTSGVNPVGVDHFCVSVEGYEADAVSEKLKQNGIASQRLYQPNQVFIRDPDGILVQLAGPRSQ
jgi:catechol 2,3-dioxygenase-like lactoylglutathione lyase family enzyme